MKLLAQRVSRATVEVDGFIDNRIGHGLVLLLALRKGDSVEALRRLASKIVRLKLWPDSSEPDVPWKLSVQDGGFEILVVLKQSLLAGFPGSAPEEAGVALSAREAQPLYDKFLAALREGWQEEMVVGAPVDAPSLRLESAMDGEACIFELASEAAPAVAAARTAPPAGVAGRPPAAAAPAPEAPRQLEPNVAMATSALQSVPRLSQHRATLECLRIFRIFSLKKFQAALAEAGPAEADAFAEALEAAGAHFSQKQRDQITSWTGIELPSITAAEVAAARAVLQEQDEAEAASLAEEVAPEVLDRQLAQLRMQVGVGPAGVERKRPFPVKAELGGAPEAGGRYGGVRPWSRPDQSPWAQPGAGAGRGAAGKGKGKGRGIVPRRQWGIAPLDESARMHGGTSDRFGYGQTAAFSDRELKFGVTAKQEPEDNEEPAAKRPAAAPRLPKGVPTLAPMTPAPAAADIEEL